MRISYGRIFKKMFKKQHKKVQEKFSERLEFFIENPQHPLLNLHSLSGEWFGCKSINITGGIRAVFEEVEDDLVEFTAIGSHSDLYS